jgi:hypothetical protein
MIKVSQRLLICAVIEQSDFVDMGHYMRVRARKIPIQIGILKYVSPYVLHTFHEVGERVGRTVGDERDVVAEPAHEPQGVALSHVAGVVLDPANLVGEGEGRAAVLEACELAPQLLAALVSPLRWGRAGDDFGISGSDV